MKDADAIGNIIKHVDDFDIDYVAKATLLRAAASYFEGKAQSDVLREILHKAVLQATMPSDMSIQ